SQAPLGRRARLRARHEPRRTGRQTRRAAWHRQELDPPRPPLPAGVHGMTERDNILAAEFVSGLLDPAQRAETERRVETDADFAGLVAQWRERLSDLDRTAPALPPDPALWQRIETG